MNLLWVVLPLTAILITPGHRISCRVSCSPAYCIALYILLHSRLEISPRNAYKFPAAYARGFRARIRLLTV